MLVKVYGASPEAETRYSPSRLAGGKALRMSLPLSATLGSMELTDHHKVQIFCAALAATAKDFDTGGQLFDIGGQLNEIKPRTVVGTANELALAAIKILQNENWGK